MRRRSDVLSGLVGAAEDDIIDPVSGDPPAFEQRSDDDGREIVGANLRQCATGPADRGANGGGDEGVTHGFILTLIFLSQTAKLPPGNDSGQVAEWLKAHAWKACVRQKRTEGSNPPVRAGTISSLT